MKMWKSTLVAAALVLAASGTALAARTDVIMGTVLEPPVLDPTANTAAVIGEITYGNIFEGLTRMDENGTVHPCLADSWTISPDGLVYTFKLHKGVKFHDGTPFDANIVKFSLDRARAKDSTNPQKGLYEPIKEVDVVDPLTAKITLSHPDGDFLFDLAWPQAVMLAPNTAAKDVTDPIGTGPFKFSNWIKGDSVQIVKNPNYWGKEPALDKATFKFISDPAAAASSLLAGDVDGFINFPAPEAVSQFQSNPQYTVDIGTTEGETIVAINNARKPFNDIRVRRALSYAVDRKAVIDGAEYGFGTPIGSHFAPHNPAYEDLTGKYPYDPAKAKELLREAGYPNGFKTVIKLPPPPYARRGGEIIAAELKQVGVDAQLVPVEWAQWLSDVFKNKDYDLTIISHVEPLDIGIYARPNYYFNYHNPKFNKVMDELNVTQDQKKRTELYHQAQEILADDAVNVFLFELPKIGIWNAKLKGLWKNWPIDADVLSDVHWEQ
ncbi:MAG: ABC transporter substrate-binding protein [Rhizobiaceae bacterium]